MIDTEEKMSRVYHIRVSNTRCFDICEACLKLRIQCEILHELSGLGTALYRVCMYPSDALILKLSVPTLGWTDCGTVNDYIKGR